MGEYPQGRQSALLSSNRKRANNAITLCRRITYRRAHNAQRDSSGIQYIIAGSNSTDALYLFWEDGDIDLAADLTIAGGSGSFDNLRLSGTADLAVVTASPSAVAIGATRLVGSPIAISWDADWILGEEYLGDSPFSLPGFMISTVSVKLVDGATTTMLASSVGQSTGSGLYYWTPTETYSSIHILIEDEKFGTSSESFAFDVDAPDLELDISGPTMLEQGVPATWWAEVTGGVAAYSYDWDYMYVCNEESVIIMPTVETCGTWNQGGTSTSWQHSVSGASFDLKIRLTVTDSDSPPVQNLTYLVVTITEAADD